MAKLIKRKLIPTNISEFERQTDPTPPHTPSADPPPSPIAASPSRPPIAGSSLAGSSRPSSAGSSLAGSSRPSSAGSPLASQLAGLDVTPAPAQQVRAAAAPEPKGGAQTPSPDAVRPQSAQERRIGEAWGDPDPAAVQRGRAERGRQAWVDPAEAQQGGAAPQRPQSAPADRLDRNPAAVQVDREGKRREAWAEPAQQGGAAPDQQVDPAAKPAGKAQQDPAEAEQDPAQKAFLNSITNLTVNDDSSGKISVTRISISNRGDTTETITLSKDDLETIYKTLNDTVQISMTLHLSNYIVFFNKDTTWTASGINKKTPP